MADDVEAVRALGVGERQGVGDEFGDRVGGDIAGAGAGGVAALVDGEGAVTGGGEAGSTSDQESANSGQPCSSSTSSPSAGPAARAPWVCGPTWIFRCSRGYGDVSAVMSALFS